MSVRLLAFDPGGTTGWAEWHRVGHQEVFNTGEVTGPDHHLALWDLLNTTLHDTSIMGEKLIVVLENFEFRKEERTRYKIDYIAGEYVGTVKTFCRLHERKRYHIQLHVSTASTGKGFWDDDKLKRIGKYHRNSKHIRDATRHLLRYRTFVMADDSLLLALR